MAKKHKNLKNILIQWDSDLSKPSDGSAQSAPDNINIVWGGYKPCWYPDNYADCVVEDMYFEDFDAVQHNSPGITAEDAVFWVARGRGDIAQHIISNHLQECYKPGDLEIKACTSAKKTYTWGDVSFVIEIADGIGTGSRRAREPRLQELDKEKKKRLIRLICRVKGEETAYDETKEVGDIQLKLDDVDMVISKVTKLNVSGMRGWKEIPWEYNYDE